MASSVTVKIHNDLLPGGRIQNPSFFYHNNFIIRLHIHVTLV